VVTIDASVLVAADTGDEAAHGSARAFLARVLAAGVTVHQPSLAIVEVTAAVARRTGDPAHARTVGAAVLGLPGIVVHDLDLDSALAAAGLASDLRLRSADAVYAATALMQGTTLVTLDAELVSRAAGVIHACAPDDWFASAEA
jgi:predicted nucleic acid-binding protein